MNIRWGLEYPHTQILNEFIKTWQADGSRLFPFSFPHFISDLAQCAFIFAWLYTLSAISVKVIWQAHYTFSSKCKYDATFFMQEILGKACVYTRTILHIKASALNIFTKRSRLSNWSVNVEFMVLWDQGRRKIFLIGRHHLTRTVISSSNNNDRLPRSAICSLNGMINLEQFLYAHIVCMHIGTICFLAYEKQ